MTPGYVYFVQAGPRGNIKIGWSTNVDKRLKMLQTACPAPLNLLHSEAGNGRDERGLHSRFHKARVTGEWFAPCNELVDYIAQRKLLPPAEYVPATVEPSKPPAPHMSEAWWAQRREYTKRPPDYYEPGNPGWKDMEACAQVLMLGPIEK
jgi:hypothetical protein